ncbi:TPA_asm: tyrosine-type recombinase/integrase [Listeria monocytogenes]|nr:tyrosine-type recombinase/integrase [Listeria monocytogenes]
MAVYKRENYWSYRISYKKENGKYGRINSDKKYRTKKEAQFAESAIKNKLSKGFHLDEGEALFTDYFEEWFKIYKKGKLSIENDVDINSTLNFVKANFDGIKLKNLTRKKYQEVLNKYGEERATATVKKKHTYMRACIKDAVQEGVIYKDPTYRVRAIGNAPTQKESEKFLTEKQLIILTKNLMTTHKIEYTSRNIIFFQIATGCRFSEALGLTWDCVDFEKKGVVINKTWDYKYTKFFSDTKNFSSKRSITIDEKTIGLLREIKLEQTKSELKKNIRNKHNLVFCTFDSFQVVSNNAVNKTLKKFCEKSGITPSITSHALRHTHASLLLFKNVNIKYLSKRLGHNSITTTLQTYSHIIDEMEQQESRHVDNIISSVYGIKEVK